MKKKYLSQDQTVKLDLFCEESLKKYKASNFIFMYQKQIINLLKNLN